MVARRPSKRKSNGARAKRTVAKARTRAKSKPNSKTKAKAVPKRHRSRPVKLSISKAAPNLSYEEAILTNIMKQSNDANVPDEALLLSSTISSMSGNINEMHHKAGISAGRSLYRIASAGREYSSAEESVGDLAAFFQNAGYKNVTYSAFPDKVEIDVHGRKGARMGANLHTFEAGVISGFLSSSSHRFVPVAETACVHNGSERCRFATTAAIMGAKKANARDGASLSRLIDHIADRAKNPNYYDQERRHSQVSGSYYAIAASMLHENGSNESMKNIATYIGSQIGAKLFSSYKPKRHTNHLVELAHTIKLLNLGNPVIESIDPFHMSVSFDELNSRKEFVDLSMAYINGLLSSGLNAKVTATERNMDGSYLVDIREE